MNQVFKGQSNLVITLETGTDLTSATNTKILYHKPNGTKGEWPATKNGSLLSYQLTDTSVDRDGMWKFQAYFELAGKKYFGEIVDRLFLKPLND